MILGSYEIIYAIGNLFMAYIIYKFIRVFYSDCKVNVTIERMAYIIYFILITITHVFLKIPIIVMGVNFILLFILTLLYTDEIKKAVLSVAIIYFSLMSIETIIVFLTSILNLDLLTPFKYESLFGIFTIRVVSFVVVLLAHGFKNVKEEYPLPNIYWFSLLAIPLATLIMLFSIFLNTALSRTLIFLSMSSALVINFFTFYLYDKISALLVSQINERIAERQSRYYEYQVQMMKSNYDNMRILRHDLKNKLSPLYTLAISGNNGELTTQLEELMDICCANKEYSRSGNSTIDSIINLKLRQAAAEDILITTDIIIPTKLPISTFDISVILGNIIDNALEAVAKTDDRWIDIKVKYTKGRLIAEIKNSYDGIVKKTNKHFYSRKEDAENHGMGFKSVQNTLQKYDGTMQITHDKRMFKTKLLMYI